MKEKIPILEKYGAEKCPDQSCGGVLMGYFYKGIYMVRCNICKKIFIEESNKLKEIEIKEN